MKDDQTIQTLEGKLSTFRGRFTLNDAAAVTGLGVAAAKDALDAMMSKYVCRLSMTENGDLIYSFGSSLRRRGEKTFSEKMAVVRSWLWKAFVAFYKAWIAVTLVVYFVIFLVILLALIVAASRGSNRKSSIPIGGVLRAFVSIFQWRTVTPAIAYRSDPWGYTYRTYQSRPSVVKENKKNFVGSVYDFVFGPPRVERDPLSDEKELAAYVRQNKGIATAAEIAALSGRTLSESEAFLTATLVRFQGEAKFTDNGVVYGQFDGLLRGTGEVSDGAIEYYWDEFEPEYPLTGNSKGRNALIVFMGLFNWVFASAFVAMAIRGGHVDFVQMDERMVAIWLGWVPFVFSVLFFGLPLARLIGISKKRVLRRRTNVRKRVMRFLFSRGAQPATLEEILQAVNSGKEEKLSAGQVESMLADLMKEYGGEVVLREQGGVQYTFPRLQNEGVTATELRAGTRTEKELGSIIYDSKS